MEITKGNARKDGVGKDKRFSWGAAKRRAGQMVLMLAVLVATPVLVHSQTQTDENLALGNPSGATALQQDNLLVSRPQHVMSYNKSQGGPNWVSWHLGRADRGRVGRQNFRPDPLLPSALQIRPTDYRGSGYDRGHLCPSADRTRTKADNQATFVISNMLPQTADLNRQVWRKLEEYCRDQNGRGQEIYQIAGGVGSIERIGGGKINVPASCWKIAVLLPQGGNDLQRIDATTRVIAVVIPNEEGEEIAESDWREYLTSVDKIEELTGYDFLKNLPDDVETALERKVDRGRA